MKRVLALAAVIAADALGLFDLDHVADMHDNLHEAAA